MGRPFVMKHPERDVELELVAVQALDSASESDHSFSLVFCAPGHEFTAQATYPLYHEELGTLDVFLVPIRHDRRGLYYEAVFNRAGHEPGP